MVSQPAIVRWVRPLMLAAMIGAASSTAQGAAYEWKGDAFSKSGVPNPLAPPDTVLMHSPSSIPLFDVSFLNKSNFSYRDSNLVFASGVTVTNDGTWTSLDDHGLLRAGNSTNLPKFINIGTFVKKAGGPTLFVNVELINDGLIQADMGLIGLNSPFKTFNEGTRLIGVGTLGKIEINNGGRFNGRFNAENVEFRHGTYQGSDARLATGRLDWTAGVFTGTWANGSGTMVARDTGGSRQWGAGVRFTNDNVFRWESGEMTLDDNALVVNNGVYEAAAVPVTGNLITAFNWSNRGVSPTFLNHGEFVYRPPPGQSATLHVGDVHFVNFGAINAFVGTINFNSQATFESGTRFEGLTVSVSSTATFRGEFDSASLKLSAGTFTGEDAKMTGIVAWNGGALVGKWTNEASIDVKALPGDYKSIGGSFVNQNTMTLLGDASDFISFRDTAAFENRGALYSSPGAGRVKKIGTISSIATSFINSGELSHEGAGSTSIISSEVTNTGKMTVRRGALSITTLNFMQRGYVLLVDATLQASHGIENFGIITGAGKIVSSLGVINRGTIAPGLSPGTLTIEGDYTHAAEGVLDIELQDGSVFDRLVIDGSAALLGGELALHCLGACDLEVGQRLAFLDVSGELTGSFGAISLHGFGSGWRFDLEYDVADGRVWLAVLEVGAPVDEPGMASLTLLGLAGLWLARRAAARAPTTALAGA